MKASEIRKKYLEFFESKGHKIIPSASLVPANDPTILFTTAGMHPLVPYLLGQEHPEGKRLTNVQKCLRTDDIDEVGDNTHLTFFQMLGNWSLGDYGREQAIEWSYEFLIDKDKGLGLNVENLAVSVFKNTEKDGPPSDVVSDKLWEAHGISKSRIAYLGKKDNWWGPPGATGPCGPDTEMFYWIGDGEAPVNFQETHDDPNWVEIWNDVFMEYEKTAEGVFIPLKQKNIDTGMGLERVSAILEGKSSVYETSLFAPIIDEIRTLIVKSDDRSERIIADHIRASSFLIADGVRPSNKDRGYILRRLIRRAVSQGKQLGIKASFTVPIASAVIKIYKESYPELNDDILKVLDDEEKKVNETRQKALREIDKLVTSIDLLQKHKSELGLKAHKRNPGEKVTMQEPSYSDLEKSLSITGKEAFDLYQTHGAPIELITEVASTYGLDVDVKDFESELKKHQELSRTASAGQFKGGLASHSDKIVRLHTATHLMNAALRKVLGTNVWQKGSNITEERTRFDFSHGEKLRDEQKAEIEKLVNEWIARDLTVKRETMPLDEARELGAVGVFGEKYPDTVSIYTVYDPKSEEIISREFCGGPHVEHTGVIGKFAIQKEEAVSAGVRRIKATIE
jgi:alanyl-tRNA synthetase